MRKAFTLIELMIVVAIIAVIAAIAIPNLVESRITSNETSASATLKAMHTAQTMFKKSDRYGVVRRAQSALGSKARELKNGCGSKCVDGLGSAWGGMVRAAAKMVESSSASDPFRRRSNHRRHRSSDRVTVLSARPASRIAFSRA